MSSVLRLSSLILSSSGEVEVAGTALYDTDACADCWLKITQSDGYPYHRQELALLRSGIERGVIGNFSNYDSIICLGAADASKEIAVIDELSRVSSRRPAVFLVDASAALLTTAIKRMAEVGIAVVGSLKVDFWSDDGMDEVGEFLRAAGKTRPLITCFGNTAGNYHGIELIKRSMSLFDDPLAIFGLHDRQADAKYGAYLEPVYMEHMKCSLRRVGVDPDDGTLSTVVISRPYGDEIAIVWTSNNLLRLRVQAKNEVREVDVVEIVVDRSSKFDVAALEALILEAGLEQNFAYSEKDKLCRIHGVSRRAK